MLGTVQERAALVQADADTGQRPPAPGRPRQRAQLADGQLPSVADPVHEPGL